MTDLVDLGKHSLQRGHPPFIYIPSPLLLVTHPILELHLNFMASQPFTDCVQIHTSICIKSCYDNMMEAIKEQWFLSVKQD